jgi:hypothetical protein
MFRIVYASFAIDSILGLFNEAYFILYGWATIWNRYEIKAFMAYFKQLHQDFLWYTEEHHEKSQESQCPGEDLNPGTSEYERER